MSVQSSIRRRVASNTALQLVGKGALLARRGLDRRPHALPGAGALRPVHAGADVHAALRGARRRGAVHDGRAGDQQRPVAHRGAGRQRADAAAAAVGGDDRAGLADQPAAALRARRPRGDRARRRPAAVRDAHELDGGRAAVAAADGTGGDRRGHRPRGRARPGRPRRGAGPRVLRGDGRGRGRGVARRPARDLGRSRRPSPPCASTPTGPCGGRCWWPACRSASRWPSTSSTSGPTR